MNSSLMIQWSSFLTERREQSWISDGQMGYRCHEEIGLLWRTLIKSIQKSSLSSLVAWTRTLTDRLTNRQTDWQTYRMTAINLCACALRVNYMTWRRGIQSLFFVYSKSYKKSNRALENFSDILTSNISISKEKSHQHSRKEFYSHHSV